MTLQSILQKAIKERWATGHFNASELDQMRAIVEACNELQTPAIIGTSEGERKHIGLIEAVAVRDAFRQTFHIPIFLNADHSKSVETAKEAIDAGYDSIHIDLSKLSFEENVKGTREVVEYSNKNQKSKIKNQNFGISIEGELGYLKGESKIQKEKIEVSPEDYTSVEEAKNFVEKTGVDRLAIVIGNIHGISPQEPQLDIDRISAIRDIIPHDVALVLHGGSGISDDQIKSAIEAGIANIHINTELRVAFVHALRSALKEDLDEVAMYKLDQTAIQAMKELVKEKLKLFGAVNNI